MDYRLQLNSREYFNILLAPITEIYLIETSFKIVDEYPMKILFSIMIGMPFRNSVPILVWD